VGSRQALYITKKGGKDSPPHVIKFPSCLPMVSPGTPAFSTTKTGRHDIDELLLKVALKKTKINQIKSNHFNVI
jgi:hypothetical protein